MRDIVGRKDEVEILQDALQSNKSELIVVYGRRRVGKTYLIRQVYKKQIHFEVTGLYKGELNDQLQNFTNEIKKRLNKKKKIEQPKKWVDAFFLLEQYLNKLKGKSKKVIFIDEFPWLATQKSKFLMYFGNFWNTYATKRKDLVVVVCGSAASYMVNQIINNKGGLHNRISQRIRLLPFNLHETDLFLKSRNIKYTKYDVLQLYMVMGGIPHYLEKIKKGNSVTQNIDRLCFNKDGALHNEFNQLFSSLFDESDKHMAIINALAKVKRGIPRNLLIQKSKISGGGYFTKKLDELIESGFVSQYVSFGKKSKEALFRLSDEYSLFYLKFIQDNKRLGKGTWQKLFNSQSYISWSGFSFETVCLKHIHQIKKGLGIDVIYSVNSSWYNKNAQIDLVIDRDDNIINVCEIKFYNAPYTISQSDCKSLKNKLNEFRTELMTRKNVYLTLITTYGVKSNPHSLHIMDNEINAETLFIE